MSSWLGVKHLPLCVFLRKKRVLSDFQHVLTEKTLGKTVKPWIFV